MLDDFVGEYRRYRATGERAIAQIPDEALNHVPSPEGNSAAMIVQHMSGNLTSRFTDFLTSDGEKPWRDRDREFEECNWSRAEVDAAWRSGWDVIEAQLAALSDDDLRRTVTIRQQPLTVHAALSRSLSHVSYHVGQIVLLARILTHEPWRWISIPKGTSDSYNAKPTMEKGPRQ